MEGRMKKSINDIGGEDWGPIPLTEKEVPDWAKLSTVLRGALGDEGAGLVNLHEGRRAREEMGYERYHALGYFEMGMQAIFNILVQKKVVTEQEVQERIDALKAKKPQSVREGS
jgi:hypothetical protein